MFYDKSLFIHQLMNIWVVYFLIVEYKILEHFNFVYCSHDFHETVTCILILNIVVYSILKCKEFKIIA